MTTARAEGRTITRHRFLLRPSLLFLCINRPSAQKTDFYGEVEPRVPRVRRQSVSCLGVKGRVKPGIAYVRCQVVLA